LANLALVLQNEMNEAIKETLSDHMTCTTLEVPVFASAFERIVTT
jgi:hypothetical protein